MNDISRIHLCCHVDRVQHHCQKYVFIYFTSQNCFSSDCSNICLNIFVLISIFFHSNTVSATLKIASNCRSQNKDMNLVPTEETVLNQDVQTNPNTIDRMAISHWTLPVFNPCFFSLVVFRLFSCSHPFHLYIPTI